MRSPPLTGKTWSPAAAFGFAVLARVEDEAGFLPGPGTRLDRLAKLQGSERTDYVLATAYHTAYVMGLLCAVALQPGRTPPSKFGAYRRAHGSARVILEYLAADDRRPHWCDDLDRLGDRCSDAVAGLLLSIALRRKVGQRDFRAVHELLKCGYTLGLVDTPASSQAAELLDRLTAFASLTLASPYASDVTPASVGAKDGLVASVQH